MYSAKSTSSGFDFARIGKTNKNNKKDASTGGEKPKPKSKTPNKGENDEAAGGKQKEKGSSEKSGTPSTSNTAAGSGSAKLLAAQQLDKNMHNIVAGVEQKNKIIADAKHPCLPALNSAGKLTGCLITALGAGKLDIETPPYGIDVPVLKLLNDLYDSSVHQLKFLKDLVGKMCHQLEEKCDETLEKVHVSLDLVKQALLAAAENPDTGKDQKGNQASTKDEEFTI